MKLISTLLFTLAVTGCSEPINNWELKAADKFCKDMQSEIDYLIVHEDRNTQVTCMNGYSHKVSKEYK